MADLAAELHGLCVLERVVAADRARADEDEAGREQPDGVASAARVVEVERWVARNLAGREPAPAPTFEEHPQKYDGEARHHHAGEEYER